ncbi:MAG TPA: WhiB family transcriptional regulator [Streptosporangiaceae bacterium]|nr:WhiB family transcriptional regulator [Streptosporangiaceae bacterium]
MSSALAFSPGAAGPLLPAGTDLGWQDRAPCAKSAYPDDWFPDAGRPSARAVRNVERTCGACPVRAQCLAYALGNGIRYGTWGGLTEEERRGIPRGAPVPDRYCRKRLHVLAGANIASDGRCLACKRETEAGKRAADRVARTGSSSPQSGRRLAA